MRSTECIEHDLITSMFESHHPNKALDVGTYSATVIIGAKEYRCEIDVQMVFSPNPRMLFYTSLNVDQNLQMLANQLDPNLNKSLMINFDGLSEPLDVMWMGVENGRSKFSSLTSFCDIKESDINLHYATGHLFNLPPFSSGDNSDIKIFKKEDNATSYSKLGCVELEADGWLIRIQEMESTQSAYKELELIGGYLITHAFSVSRTDRQCFSASDLNCLAHILQRFMSFVFGQWAGVSFIQGLNANQEVVSQGLGSFRVGRDKWQAQHSWFDEQHGNMLSNLWPGFYSLCHNVRWKDKIQLVIAWYVAANETFTSASNDIRICMAQSAIELILDIEEIDRHTKNANGKKRNLSTKERMLNIGGSARLNLPTKIPPELNALSNYDSIPDAITRLRNDVAHPESKETIVQGTWLQAWRLSMWYLELMVLKRCNYVTKYAVRFKKRHSGTVETVP